MKKAVSLSIAAIVATMSLHAQDDALQKALEAAAEALQEAPAAKDAEDKPRYWDSWTQFDLGTSNTSLWNWAAGGYNTLTLNLGADANLNYSKDLVSWTNRLQLQYGFLWSADKENLLQKSNDLIKFESRLAYKITKDSKWNYSASFDFRSQFTDSYDSYKQDEQSGKWNGVLKSSFLSPAYSTAALGMEWTPTDWFNVNIAPLTGGFTICTTEELRKKYGMKLREDGLDPELGGNYRSQLFQFGAQVKTNYMTSINDNFKYETQLVLFTDYLNKPFRYYRVNWDNKITWQLAKYFKIGLSTWMIYDPIVVIDGKQRIQFKEFFSVNFTYLISNKKK